MIYPIRTIVAGIAELDPDDAVLGDAIQLANRLGAALHLVHAYELPSLMWDAYGRMGYVRAETIEEYGSTLQARLERIAAQRGGVEHVRCHVVAGSPAFGVREVATETEADLIVVGATRHGRLGQVLLGTTAQRVLRGSPVPVLIRRRGLPEQCRRVLTTTDLSPFSEGVHELGLDVLATMCDIDADRPLEIRALLVVHASVALPPPFESDQLREIAMSRLEEFLESRRDRGVPVSRVVRVGEPAEEIAKEAEEWEPDYVVVGTHSREGTERWLLGSVAEAATRATAANVLVIPAGAQEKRQLPVRKDATAAAG